MNDTQPSEWRRVRKLTLAAVPSAVGCARLLAQHALADWRIDKQSATAVERAVAVLVSHAVETTGVTDALPTYSAAFDRLTLVKVRLILEPRRVVIEVWDSSSAPPQEKLARHPTISASTDWGYYLPSRQRRVLWCELSTFFESNVEEVTVVPRRAQRRVLRPDGTQQARAMRDPEILRRVLDGLRNLDGDSDPKAGGREHPKPPGGG